MLQRIQNFSTNLLYDYLHLPLWLFIFTLFRLAFLIIFSGYADSSVAELFQVLRLGLRLSLKTSGIICLIGGVFASLPVLISAKWPAQSIRTVWHSLMLLVFTIAFCARIPYYSIYQSGFNMMLLNVFYDDTHAMLDTAITEYNLFGRVAAALVLAALLCYLLRLVQQYLHKHLAAEAISPKAAVLCIILLPAIWVFCRFGGAFSYAHSVNYFNVARFHTTLLNEAVLDDGQALYRVYSSYRIQKKTQQLNFSVAELQNKLAAIRAATGANSIDAALRHTVSSPRLFSPPRTVFFILGENNAAWPFLPEYSSLQLVPRQQRLVNTHHAMTVNTMLASGSGTIMTLKSLLTGLPDTGIYENYQAGTFRQSPYGTGISTIMHSMGYKTVFWYGGFSEWQNLKSFALSQSFDEFHCADEFTYDGGNSWGCPDYILVEAIKNYDTAHPAEKVFHFILTTSNHPPYDIDLAAAGIDTSDLQGRLPSKIADTAQSLKELGHIRYMDEAIGRLVQATDRKDSLFVITGDHAERFSFATAPSSQEQYAVPCIIYSQGLDPKTAPGVASGCQQQLPATLAELCAPAGFSYSSFLPALWQNGLVFNQSLIIKNNQILPLAQADESALQMINNMREIAAWRILKGNDLTP